MQHQPIPKPPGEAERFSAIYQFFYQPLLMLTMVTCSWWTSNAGVLAMADWISGASDTTQQIALLVTASAMGAQYALWHYAMRLIPRYESFQARSIGVVVVVVLIVILGLSSTYTSFIGLAQDSARGLELQRQADAYAAKAELLSRRAAAMNDALLVIGPQAESACARYEQELQTGAITGARGKGIVTGYLLGFCTGKRAIADALEETIAANESRSRDISALSAELDQIIFQRDVPIGARELAFLGLARQLDRLLQDLENADRTRGLRAASNAMAGSVAELESVTGTLAQAQAQAVAAIVQEERASGAAISALVDDIQSLPLPHADRANLSPAQVVVLKHWTLHLPQLALALAIDLFAPLSTLLFAGAAIKSRARKFSIHTGEFQ
ncbi:hypothetical protein LA6_003680 [Marinibacterium anthonyi]|nr:hypothetical protein LA6_003680 [Marinibacterium anthonyi]